MSAAEIKRFAADCRTDPELAGLVSGAGSDLEAIVGAANARGYDFTADDARHALAQTALNELQLAAIAGGKSANIPGGWNTIDSGPGQDNTRIGGGLT